MFIAQPICLNIRMTKTINILGVTGSIGQSTADIIAAHSHKFDVQMVCAHTDVVGLSTAARRLNATVAIIADEAKLPALEAALNDANTIALGGDDAIIEHAARPVDITVAAIVGMAGLKSLMPAIQNSNAVAIANKEPLVAAGDIVMAAAREYSKTLLPIDSEHNAIFQVFDHKHKNNADRIILTASGGPFLDRDLSTLKTVTPREATAHPNWSMGDKISIDSATMMNKALEVIEAHYLFDLPPERIEVLIHPQSVVHGMVEYSDGSVLTQMGASDMRTPIARILDYPNRLKTCGQTLDLKTLSTLTFRPITKDNFPALYPALGLAYDCLRRPPATRAAACAALNAANEIAVESFLAHNIAFLDIVKINTQILHTLSPRTMTDINDIYEWDAHIRVKTHDLIDTAFRIETLDNKQTKKG